MSTDYIVMIIYMILFLNFLQTFQVSRFFLGLFWKMDFLNYKYFLGLTKYQTIELIFNEDRFLQLVRSFLFGYDNLEWFLEPLL